MGIPDLSPEEALRYSRQIILPEVGVEGQKRLKAARVLCVGAGGLGSPLTLYLAAAGVGSLGVIDADDVDLSNIHRQVLYASADVGRPKVVAATERLRRLNPEIEVLGHAERLTGENVMTVFDRYDCIADGTDNFATRYLINDACVLSGKPDVCASVFRFEAQISVFDARRGPCYRCLFPEPPPAGLVPSCADAGVLGVLPGIAGTLQALEVLKLLLGEGEPLIGRLLLIDTLAASFREVSVRKDPGCAICGNAPTIRTAVEGQISCSSGVAGAGVEPDLSRAITVEELQDRIQGGPPVALIDVREVEEHAIARIEGAHLIPLGELAGRLGELDRERTYVVFCHTGVRSAYAVALMRRAGLRAVNLTGGIDAWAARIDRAVPRY